MNKFQLEYLLRSKSKGRKCVWELNNGISTPKSAFKFPNEDAGILHCFSRNAAVIFACWIYRKLMLLSVDVALEDMI